MSLFALVGCSPSEDENDTRMRLSIECFEAGGVYTEADKLSPGGNVVFFCDFSQSTKKSAQRDS